MEAMGAVRIDQKAYGKLLLRMTPKVIESSKDHERLLGEIEHLMDRGDRRTPEEDAILQLLTILVDAWESKHFPIARPSPADTLLYLMDQRGLRQIDLVPVLGSSGAVSDAVNARRAISRNQAKRLAAFFNVGVELFI